MNNKGTIVLRDFIFMIIIFGGVLALCSIFVIDMAQEYENTEMESSYNDLGTSGLGDLFMDNISSSVKIMRNQTDDAAGSFASGFGIIKGAATILKLVLTSPVFIGNSLGVMMSSIGVPVLVEKIITNIIILLIYAMIIFVIISALLRGGKV